eukprot:TRINITY_DN1924_c0_g2_i1.p1 TRINITY_DN1924_c0_g2~~TRINITY_DN1924_c0_g2_i1.p1  ORF type:complete len:258 (-),score=44.39 TRINITY_DN1924_c0_g2_i1:124-897(-)
MLGMLLSDNSMEVAVSGLEYDVEHVFRFTPKPGRSDFVAHAIRCHMSKMLAVIIDHVDKSAKDELRMYKFIAAAVAEETLADEPSLCDAMMASHPDGRGSVDPDADIEVPALERMQQSGAASAERQTFRDAPSLHDPIPGHVAHTHPALDVGVAPCRADSLPPLQSKSCTEPSHHKHACVQMEHHKLSHFDEDGFPVAPPRRPGSGTFARRGSHARPGRVVAMDLSDLVRDHREAVCDREDVMLCWQHQQQADMHDL